MKHCQTCCFTGYRCLPKERMEAIEQNLDREIDNLIDHCISAWLYAPSGADQAIRYARERGLVIIYDL